jgi:hypothetical protein
VGGATDYLQNLYSPDKERQYQIFHTQLSKINIRCYTQKIHIIDKISELKPLLW